jgi:predicted enzyme related to lactoylglutathione lyase
VSVPENLRQQLLATARGAAHEPHDDQVESLYNQLVDELEQIFGKNQKDVAAELQRVAKTVEDEGDAEAAFGFKQRTCEVLLKRSMSQRRAAREGTAPTPAMNFATTSGGQERTPVLRAEHSRLLGSLEFICFPTDDAERDAAFYRGSFAGQTLFDHQEKTRLIGMKVASGPAIVFLHDSRLTGCQPLFFVSDMDKVLEQLTRDGVGKPIGPIQTAIGTIYGFVDPNGHKFAILDKKH